MPLGWRVIADLFPYPNGFFVVAAGKDFGWRLTAGARFPHGFQRQLMCPEKHSAARSRARGGWMFLLRVD